MPEYTPSEERLESLYAWAYAWRTEDDLEDGETDLSEMRTEQRAEARRAIAKIKAEAAREALLAAADDFAEREGIDCLFNAGATDDVSAVLAVDAWLRARANQTETGDV